MSTGPGCTITAAQMSSNAPRLEQQRFSATGLFGGRAHQHDRQPEVVGHLRERQRGADRGRGDDVVPARMSDARQRVVLGADRDGQRRRSPIVGAECRVQPGGGRGDREAPLGDQRLGLGAAAVFGEREFRLGVDVV